MRNIPSCFLLPPPASGERRGRVDPHSGVRPRGFGLVFTQKRGGGSASVILMMLWYLKDFSLCTDRA